MIHRVLTGLTLLLSGSFVAYGQGPEVTDEPEYACPEDFYGRLNKRILPPEGEAPYLIHDGFDKNGNPIINIPWDRCQELAMRLNATDAVRFEGGPIHSPPPPGAKKPSPNRKKSPASKKKSPPPKRSSPPPKPSRSPPPAPSDPDAPFVAMCEGINFRERFGAKITSWGEPLPALGYCYCYQPGSMLAYLGNYKSDTISCMRDHPTPPPSDEPPPNEDDQQ